jgi:hypothetical protein
MLEPDRGQIETFVEALFRHAGREGWVSLRAFYEDGSAKPFRITPTSLAGGFKFLIDAAEDDARRAASFPRPIVFCPPIAVFTNKDRAREIDIAQGLALSVECDRQPSAALAKLGNLLGPPTVTVASGGHWSDPETGEVQDKLHLHYRLAKPTIGDEWRKLKQARDMATRYVGGDPSNKTVIHPIRWPGSWHRKAKPRLCCIVSKWLDIEIDLDEAHARLAAVVPPIPSNGRGNASAPAEYKALISGILTGETYHEAVIRLSAKLISAGASEDAAAGMVCALMECSQAPRDPRWHARYREIARATRGAKLKYGDNRTQIERERPAWSAAGRAIRLFKADEAWRRFQHWIEQHAEVGIAPERAAFIFNTVVERELGK